MPVNRTNQDRGATLRPKREELQERLWVLDSKYESATGRSGILYVSHPKGRANYVFGDGTVSTSKASAVRHLEELLAGLEP